MTDINHRIVDTNGIKMHYVGGEAAGIRCTVSRSPVLPGEPDSALAERQHRPPDQRGYGRGRTADIGPTRNSTSRRHRRPATPRREPPSASATTGGHVAWNAAMCPGVSGVVGMSVPLWAGVFPRREDEGCSATATATSSIPRRASPNTAAQGRQTQLRIVCTRLPAQHARGGGPLPNRGFLVP